LRGQSMLADMTFATHGGSQSRAETSSEEQIGERRIELLHSLFAARFRLAITTL